MLRPIIKTRKILSDQFVFRILPQGETPVQYNDVYTL